MFVRSPYVVVLREKVSVSWYFQSEVTCLSLLAYYVPKQGLAGFGYLLAEIARINAW